ncbi:TlpA family protein disulfide reductase [Halohasta salina]|uniref:TlpA family protein disulfide reductase n=1 Tax=Halohasta salina TaxID=2961621 RepID=UPI0020A59A39|nr:redoxin family protein [Halohasta salina]
MNRRRLLAGLAGLGVVGGGWAATGGWPDGPSGGETADEDATTAAFTVDTIDAPGSSAGTLSVPADRPTLVDFVSVGCEVCSDSMPALTAFHAEYGDRLRFLSLSTDPVGFSVEESSLREWWADHDGAWALGVDDQLSVANDLDVTSVPTAVVIDAEGRIRGRTSGRKSVDELESLVEPVG